MLAAQRLPVMTPRFAVYYFLRANNEVTLHLTQIRVFSLIPVMFRVQLEAINYSIGIRKNAKRIKSGTAKLLGVRIWQWRK
jgi:hypothetical protein